VALSPEAEAQLEQQPQQQQSSSEDSHQLSEDEQRYVRELQQRDAEVRAHEAAHQSAGGGLTGGASFSTVTGPDGRQYAVGGEVSIDMSGGATPDETISRAQKIRAAALAPAEPSGQDRAVAAAASRMESAALREKSEATAEALQGEEGASKEAPEAQTAQAAEEAEDPRAPWDVAPKDSHSHQSDCGFCVRSASAYGQ